MYTQNFDFESIYLWTCATLILDIHYASFIKARAMEMDAMMAIISGPIRKKPGKNRAAQSVPIHMRRRAASHNIRRLPRKLQQKALREVWILQNLTRSQWVYTQWTKLLTNTSLFWWNICLQQHYNLTFYRLKMPRHELIKCRQENTDEDHRIVWLNIIVVNWLKSG